MSIRTTSNPSPSAISSQASESGPTPSAAPDGLTIDLFGPALAPVSRSPRQAISMAQRMAGTYGLRGSDSSASARLASCLANRLRANLASRGSTMYRLTWKAVHTPLRRPICALRASALPTFASGSTGWPTPQARDGKGAMSTGSELSHNSRPLNEIARLAGWPTPLAQDSEASGGEGSIAAGKRGLTLTAITKRMELARRRASGILSTGSCAGMADGDLLNPSLPRWLLGLPRAWDDCAPTGTRSSPHSLKPSSSRASTRSKNSNT